MFFFQAEDGIRGLVRSRGLGDGYKRQSKERYARDQVRIDAVVSCPARPRIRTLATSSWAFSPLPCSSRPWARAASLSLIHI